MHRRIWNEIYRNLVAFNSSQNQKPGNSTLRFCSTVVGQQNCTSLYQLAISFAQTSLKRDETLLFTTGADPGGRAVYGVGLRPLACWDCGFEFRRGHTCLSLVSVVCCQVEVFAGGGGGRSHHQRSTSVCGVSECDREASTMRKS
jgi:hypothetical protein